VATTTSASRDRPLVGITTETAAIGCGVPPGIGKG